MRQINLKDRTNTNANYADVADVIFFIFMTVSVAIVYITLGATL